VSAGGVLLTAGALLAAVRAYGYIEGDRLLGDRFTEARLRRTSLRDADAFFLANQQHSGIIVCLTSIPSRVELLDDTLKSLLLQRVRAQAIHLHLPEFSRREQAAYQVPERIAALAGVRVVRCADYGPATKLIPALQSQPPEQRLLAVDDDRLYRDDMLDHVARFARAHPDDAFGFSGWLAPRDLTDRPSTVLTDLFTRPPVPYKSQRQRKARRVDILQGYSGYTVKPAFFDLAELLDYGTAPPAAFYVDDVWISGHCRAAKYVLPAPFSNFQSWRHGRRFKQSSLALTNRGGGDLEQRNNTIMLRHLSARWLVSRAVRQQVP
jgi:hypothetical protein